MRNRMICCDTEKGMIFVGYEHRTANSVRRIYYALIMACITGVLAQVRIPLPWTPVPVTGQTIAVLASGYLLGRWWGGVSQLIYLVGGAAGIPWFSGWKGGMAILLGPTSGFLVGFILAALFMGEASHRMRETRFSKILVIASIANFIFIYTPGLIHLRLWIEATNGAYPSIPELFRLGLLPFIFHDLMKIILCSSLICNIQSGSNNRT